MTRQFLSIDGFDPLKIDISFLEEVSAQIPTHGYMDTAMAEHLATATLKAADYCIDLLAQATLYLGHCDATKRSIRSQMIKQALIDKIPSTVAKDACYDDEKYIIASNNYNMALAWSSWLENKYGALLKTHHLCKDLIRKSELLKGSSDWSPSSGSLESETFSEPFAPAKSKPKNKSSWKV